MAGSSLRQALGLSSAHCASFAAVNVTGPVSIYVIYNLISSSEGLQPGTLLFLTLSSFLLKALNVIELVSICHCKGGRIMSFGKAFGLATCPLLFFTLPCSLGRPV